MIALGGAHEVWNDVRSLHLRTQKDEGWYQSLSDKILPSWAAFVVLFSPCRNNSEKISPNYLESADICRIFAPVSLTI